MPQESRTVALPAGSIRYTDTGSGPVLVFVHGVFVNALLWRKAVELLAGSFRCIVPTLPLGAHDLPLTDPAQRSPRGMARVVAQLIAALDLHDVTIVGNDSGGAITQLVIAHHPERIARAVLTNCDAFENFPPPVLLPLYYAAHIPGFVWLLARLLQLRVLQRGFARTVARRAPDDAVLDSWFRPLRKSSVRRDLRDFIKAVSAPELIAAATSFGAFTGRVLIVWGTGDLFFPLRDARRLAASFRSAHVIEVAGSRTFVPEDAPMALAESIERFVAATAAV